MLQQKVLPLEYKQRLTKLTLLEIAQEAARMRSDGQRNGTATKLILRYTCQVILANDHQMVKRFQLMYRSAWKHEREERKAGRSSRPENRPVKGGHGRFRGRRYPVGYGLGHSVYQQA